MYLDKESITNNLFGVCVYLHPLDVWQAEGGADKKSVKTSRNWVSKESTCLGHQNIPGDRQCMHSATATLILFMPLEPRKLLSPIIRGLLYRVSQFFNSRAILKPYSQRQLLQGKLLIGI